jgi:hypothetical protein
VATVVARTEVTVATIDRESFNRLLGPLEDILKRTAYEACSSAPEQKCDGTTGHANVASLRDQLVKVSDVALTHKNINSHFFIPSKEALF